VKRWVLASGVICCALLSAPQQPAQPKKQPPAQTEQKEEEPPEEDESAKPKVYALNPLESARNITAGDFYFKKGRYNAALWRYTEATKWDPGSSEAFFKVGEADEKLKDRKGARDAYQKCADLDPNGKLAIEARRRLEKLGK